MIGPHAYEEIALDPGWCKCGLSKDHSDHVADAPAPAAPSPDAVVIHLRIKEFLDRYGESNGSRIRILKNRQNKEVIYDLVVVDELSAAAAAQEMIDILWLHADKGTCRGCQADIWWIRSNKGKAIPYSALGVVHFVDCPARAQFRRVD